MFFKLCRHNSNLANMAERYLLYYGYIGTKFRGVDKEGCKYKNYEVDSCLISIIENALNEIDQYTANKNLCISSRTDAGVHALNSTAHCDIWIPNSYIRKYKCNRAEYLTKHLNRIFAKAKEDIRIFKTIQVPKSFHARFSAISRTYLYRFGTIDIHDGSPMVSPFTDYDALIPMAELNRSHFIRGPFDLCLGREACKQLIGEKDFRAFTSPKKNYSVSTVRKIYQMDISPAQPLMNPGYDPSYSGLSFFHLTVTANSFCYRQVRRMVAVILAIGTGQYNIDIIRKHLDNPKTNHFDPRLRSASEYGLYLTNVEYPPESLILDEDVPSTNINENVNSDTVETNTEKIIVDR